jgi:hypothetical protein
VYSSGDRLELVCVCGEWVDGREDRTWDCFSPTRGVVVDRKSIQKVYSFRSIIVHLQSYYYVGRIECNSFLKHSYVYLNAQIVIVLW